MLAREQAHVEKRRHDVMHACNVGQSVGTLPGRVLPVWGFTGMEGSRRIVPTTLRVVDVPKLKFQVANLELEQMMRIQKPRA